LFDFQSNEFIVVNHSQLRDWEGDHGKLLHFNTNTKRCPFPTAFRWHEYRVRGFHPTRGDRSVTIRRGDGLQGRCSSAEQDGVGIMMNDGGTGRCDGGRDPDNDSVRAGEQVEGRDANGKSWTFTPTRLEGKALEAWLQAARQHSSWRDCVKENLSWDGSAEENIEKYQREMGLPG
jgi:hypothetical protein